MKNGPVDQSAALYNDNVGMVCGIVDTGQFIVRIPIMHMISILFLNFREEKFSFISFLPHLT